MSDILKHPHSSVRAAQKAPSFLGQALIIGAFAAIAAPGFTINSATLFAITRLSVETEPLPSRRPAFQLADPKRFIRSLPLSCPACAVFVRFAARGFEDQSRDF